MAGTQHLYVCSLCGVEFDNRVMAAYREIEGWERLRLAGGANQITLRRTTGRVACHACITLRSMGREGQLGLEGT